MIIFYILVFAAPMPNHPFFEAVIAGLSIFKWLGIASALVAIVELVNRRKVHRFFSSMEMRAFLILFGIAVLSIATHVRSADITFSPMLSYASFLLFFFVTIALVNTLQRLRTTMLALIAGEAMASLYVIREFQVSGGTNVRPGYIAGDSNYFATCALLVIPVALYFAWKGTSRTERWFCMLSLLVILIAFTLASSRGGLVGLCFCISYMVLRSGKSRRAAIVVTLLLLPMLLLAPASPLSRMLHPGYADELGAQIRWDFWRAGLRMIRNHPLMGIGLGNFTEYSKAVIVGIGRKQGIACNTFLEIAAELGVPGLIAYCAVIVGALRSAGRLRRYGKRRKDPAAFYAGEAMLAGMYGFIAAAMFVSAEYQKPFWGVVALAAAVPTIVSDHRVGRDAGKVTGMTQVPRPYITKTA